MERRVRNRGEGGKGGMKRQERVPVNGKEGAGDTRTGSEAEGRVRKDGESREGFDEERESALGGEEKRGRKRKSGWRE
eukprot:6171548-Pleurochrysis_carterae.AAC.1